MSEIKLDQLGVNLTPTKLQQPTARQLAENVKTTESVTVTNHLSKLVNLLGGDEVSPEENARVAAVKTLIAAGQYKVDLNTLSDRLVNSGLLNTGG